MDGSGNDHASPMATDEEQYNFMPSLPHMGLLVNFIMRRAESNIETTATDYSDGEYEDMIEYSDDDAYSGGDGDMIEYGDDDTYSGGGFGSVPASSDEIARLEKAKVGDTREAECAVCMESFQEGAEIRKLPCSHGFHERCISDWLRVSRVCPYCRFALPADDKWTQSKTEVEHSAIEEGYDYEDYFADVVHDNEEEEEEGPCIYLNQRHEAL
jgi:glutaredoxin